MDKTDMCVVRNGQYRRGGLNKRERHNERKNADYENDNIMQEREAYNVSFKQCDGMGYAATFDKMVADGVISTRGLGQDPHIVDELVFDVNSAYFENHGGYEYAISFYEEAYRCAIKEIGGEQYVLSAVMHADERHSELSEQLGRDVFHYHLHVVYVPVVEKEIYFKKNNKDPEKAGKLREVIKQVSHSKKWPKLKQYDERGEVVRNAKGKAVLFNTYSLLQDHFFQHMSERGFTDFERGKRGSTAKHLTDLQFKAKKETEKADKAAERAAAFAAVAEEKQQTAAALDTAIGDKKKDAAELDKQAAKKQKQLDGLNEQISAAKKVTATAAEVEKMGTPTVFGGNFTVTGSDMKKLKPLAVEGAKSRGIIADLKKRVTDLLRQVADLTKEVNNRKASIKDELSYYQARQRAPKRLAEVMADIMRKPAERNEQQRTAPERKRGHGAEL